MTKYEDDLRDAIEEAREAILVEKESFNTTGEVVFYLYYLEVLFEAAKETERLRQSVKSLKCFLRQEEDECERLWVENEKLKKELEDERNHKDLTTAYMCGYSNGKDLFSKWREIGEMPKAQHLLQGNHALVRTSGNIFFVASFDAEESVWKALTPYEGRGYLVRTVDPEDKPTHWMPLPDAPTEVDSDG